MSCVADTNAATVNRASVSVKKPGRPIAAAAGYPYVDLRRHIISRVPLFDPKLGERTEEGQAPYPLAGLDADAPHVWAMVAPGQVIALDNVDATLAIPDFSGPFTLTATALSGGQGVALDLQGGVFSAFAMGRVVPLTASLTAGGSTIGFDGRGGYAPVAAEGAR